MCSHWLSQTAEAAQAAILQLLRGCRDAAELAAADSKLRAAIQSWKHTPQPESTVPQGDESFLFSHMHPHAGLFPTCACSNRAPHAATTAGQCCLCGQEPPCSTNEAPQACVERMYIFRSEPSLQHADILSPRAPSSTPSAHSAATPFAAAAALPEAAPALPEDWEGVCQWVMGGRIALWDELFEKAFLQVGPLTLSAAACLVQWVMYRHLTLMTAPGMPPCDDMGILQGLIGKDYTVG